LESTALNCPCPGSRPAAPTRLPHHPPVRPPQDLCAAHAEIEGLEGALAAAQASAGPSARTLIALERRLAAVARDHAAAESRWRAAAAAAGGSERAARAELEAARASAAADIAARDAVIQGFRGQVDGLLAMARALQQQKAAAATAR
jgi:hypothetical protein